MLQGVDLCLKAGSRTWIGGVNGVGKTTLLRVLCGIVMPDAGQVTVDGRDPSRDWTHVRKHIGYMPAGNAGMYQRLTVRQHLDLWARIGFVPAAERAVRVAEAIDAFGLAGFADARVDRMSTGQRQRVRVAITLLPEPQLVLMDEPRSSLDGPGHAVLAAGLAAVAERGGAVLWCSPEGEEVGMHADHRFLLRAGRLEPT